MIEAHRGRKVFRITPEGAPRVISGLKGAGIPRNARENNGHGVPARIAVGTGIHAEHAEKADGERGFLTHLPDGCVLHVFPLIDETAGQGKAVRLVSALYKHDAPVFRENNHVRGGGGIGVDREGAPAQGTGNLLFHRADLLPDRHEICPEAASVAREKKRGAGSGPEKTALPSSGAARFLPYAANPRRQRPGRRGEWPPRG